MKIIVLDAEGPGAGSPGEGDTGRAGARLAAALTAQGDAVEVIADRVVAARTALTAPCDALVACVADVDDAFLEWCADLRAGADRLALLVVADQATPEGVVAALDAGADDCVTRPLTIGEIAARLRALDRRGGIPRPTTLAVGSLVLDPAAHRAWRGERELELSMREFMLLHALAREPGRALAREGLLDVVWNRGPEEASNVVDQVIARLRRIVDEPFGLATIETVRGLGYRLVADTGD